ncbi:MAG: nuclear transport factor 2 family protein [Pseudomonadota bacterium]
MNLHTASIKFACLLMGALIGSAHAEVSASSTGNPEAVAQIEQIVHTFKKSIIDKDAKTLGALFLSENNSWLTVLDAGLYPRVKAKKPEAKKVRASTYQDFVGFVGSTKEAIEEKFSNVQVHTNGSVAAVYFDFVFVMNDKVTNRGSESWHLVKTDEGWRISSMIYSDGD